MEGKEGAGKETERHEDKLRPSQRVWRDFGICLNRGTHPEFWREPSTGPNCGTEQLVAPPPTPARRPSNSLPNSILPRYQCRCTFRGPFLSVLRHGYLHMPTADVVVSDSRAFRPPNLRERVVSIRSRGIRGRCRWGTFSAATDRHSMHERG